MLHLREQIHRRHLPRDGAFYFPVTVWLVDVLASDVGFDGRLGLSSWRGLTRPLAFTRPLALTRPNALTRLLVTAELLIAAQARRGVGNDRPFADRTDGNRGCHLVVIGGSARPLYRDSCFWLSIRPLMADHSEVPLPPRALDDDGEFATVLRAAQNGQEWAAARLFAELHPRLSRFLRAQAPGAGDDLASEVWVAIAGGLAEFRGDSRGFRAWAFTIARRRLVDHRRKSSRRRTDAAPVDTFAGLPARDAPDHEAVESLAGQEAAEFVLSILPPDQAEVVLLRVLGDLDADQVATMMGRSANWVRVTQHRALRKLADRLGSRIDVMP